MNCLSSRRATCLFGSFLNNSQRMLTREASKKASGGGNKNAKQADGSRKGIWKGENCKVYTGDVLVNLMSKMWFHPGLNVRLGRGRRLDLIAMKSGTVKITCEKPDLNFEHKHVKKYYTGREGQTFYKKHFNVIPDPQHTNFKCIDQI